MRLKAAKGNPSLRRFAEQVADPMILITCWRQRPSAGVLAVLGKMTALRMSSLSGSGHWINAVLGNVRKAKWKKAIKITFADMAATTSKVMQDGKYPPVILSKDLVVGISSIWKQELPVPAFKGFWKAQTHKKAEEIAQPERIVLPVTEADRSDLFGRRGTDVPLGDRKEIWSIWKLDRIWTCRKRHNHQYWV